MSKEMDDRLDIIGVGESDVDIYLRVDVPPARGEKIRGEEMGKMPGGMIGNFCSGAALGGMKCGIVSVVGDDENGNILMADYRNRGIDQTGLKVVPGGRTMYCVVFLDGSSEKYLTVVPTPLANPAVEDVDMAYVHRAGYVHMNSMDRKLALYVSERLDTSRTRLSLDYEPHAEMPGFDAWRPVLEKTSLLFMNEDGVHSLLPEKTPEEAARQVLALGAEYVVVTCAEKGGYVFSREGRFHYPALYAGPPVDTTGAGDCFNSFFLSRIISGDSPQQAARCASAAASLSLLAVGARAGLPSLEQVEAFLAKGPKAVE